MWFRPERIQTVTWGGDPFKAVVVGNDPTQLSPRRSFAQWHQLVEGTSDPWTAADLTAARLIGDTLADVILQSRSVRMLIAHDQLAAGAPAGRRLRRSRSSSRTRAARSCSPTRPSRACCRSRCGAPSTSTT